MAISVAPQPDPAAVVTKAALNAAERLGLPARDLAQVTGVSEAGISRMRNGALSFSPGTKPYELAVLFIRLFRSLDALTGGDEAVARAWLRNDNTVLGRRPLDAIREIAGLTGVIAYLDSRRAIV